MTSTFCLLLSSVMVGQVPVMSAAESMQMSQDGCCWDQQGSCTGWFHKLKGWHPKNDCCKTDCCNGNGCATGCKADCCDTGCCDHRSFGSRISGKLGGLFHHRDACCACGGDAHMSMPVESGPTPEPLPAPGTKEGKEEGAIEIQNNLPGSPMSRKSSSFRPLRSLIGKMRGGSSSMYAESTVVASRVSPVAIPVAQNVAPKAVVPTPVVAKPVITKPVIATPVAQESVARQELRIAVEPALSTGPMLEQPPTSASPVRPALVSKLSHDPEYRWITGQLQRVGPRWVLHYSTTKTDDRFGGSVVLAFDQDLSQFRDGDLVNVRGEVINSARESRSTTYLADSVQLIER